MDTSSVGVVTPQNYSFGETPEDMLALDCGQKLGPVNVCYETYGALNQDASNAILITHALSGNAHVAGYNSEDDTKPGWWDEMIGPGKYIDTNKYFVVCSNTIGGCSGSTGPRSVNPSTGKRYNMDFPVITIADMVRAQYRLMKHLGIEAWLSVIGGSMGGMQAFEWAILYPEAVRSVCPIATTSRISPQGIAFNWVGRDSIMNDPSWLNGEYEDDGPERGLSTARMLAHITYLSEESMDNKFGRDLQEADKYSFDFKGDFAVESYLRYQGDRFVGRFDANSYLYITRAIDYFDVSERAGGDLPKALDKVTMPCLMVSFTSDWLFPPAQSQDVVRAMLKNGTNVSYCNIDSSYGHDAFLLEVETLGDLLSNFIRNSYTEVRNG